MSLSKILLIAICAAVIGLGSIVSSKSQGMMGQGTQGMMGQGMMGSHGIVMMGKYIGIPGTQMSGNVASVWLLDSSDKQIIACKYLLDAGTITCAKQDLP